MTHLHSTNEQSIQLLIDSEFAEQNNDNTGNITVDFEPIIARHHHMLLFNVVSCMIPITWYNVNSNNNYLKYTINTVDTEVTITEQNYNIDNLVTWLNSNLANFTVTYSSYTNKMTFVHDTDDFTISSESTCLELIGFTNTYHISATRSLTSDIMCDMSYTKYITIDCDEIAVKNISTRTKQQNNMLVSVPVNGDAYDVINYWNYGNTKNIITNKYINTLHLVIRDTKDNEIDMNGINWQMVIEFDFIVPKIVTLTENDFLQSRQLAKYNAGDTTDT